MDKDRYSRLMVAFKQRHHSLIADGYYDVYVSFSAVFHYVKMRHFNGGIISLTADFKDYSLTQRTKGKIVHTEIIR